MKVQNDILLEIDKKRGVILVLLDLSAAFDTIDHETLIRQLSIRLGIKGVPLSWFRSYLSKRSQAVFINHTTSQIVILLFGVPQGSVLGPILFTIYTIPLGDILRFHDMSYHLYADDTQLYISFDILNHDNVLQAITKVQHCLSDIKVWMDTNKLKLNEDKTEVLFISSPRYSDHLSVQAFKIDTVSIIPAANVKNLGVKMDNALCMKPHISSLCSSANYHVRNIGSIRKYISKDACIQLIHAFISSRLDYCNALLYGLPDSSIQKLQRILHIAARTILSQNGPNT